MRPTKGAGKYSQKNDNKRNPTFLYGQTQKTNHENLPPITMKPKLTPEQVLEAITNELQGGSTSFGGIEVPIPATYKLDPVKLSNFLAEYINKSK
jgi:hypothetical protein